MTIHHGDCLDILKTLPDNSVDSIVTDPPYGLSFMGKKWDYDVPSEEIWRECWRVLKPGGHLLAFAGTRTQHRMAVRIEDAGFEIRDCIMWHYASGFPKSLNVGCKCGTKNMFSMREEVESEEQVSGETKCDMLKNMRRENNITEADRGKVKKTESNYRDNMPCLREEGIEAERMDEKSENANVFKTLQRDTKIDSFNTAFTQRTTGMDGEQLEVLPKKDDRAEQSRMEGRGNVLPETWKLQADKICAMPEGILVDGEKRRVCDGTSTNHGAVIKSPIDEDRGCSSSESQPAGQQTGEFRIISEQQGAQDRRSGEGRICATCGGIIDYIGWGTALKPATEIITVARKPLSEKTVAANVLKWGTGAINIDGGRVNANGESLARPFGSGGISAAQLNKIPHGTITGEDKTGRWPANVCHDGSDEVLELFPETKSGTRNSGMRLGMGYHGGNGGKAEQFAGDSGSAARFFYCAKSSKTDRGADNKHPTVKPTDLMRYLCRLVTPPGGVVLDPFMGSGSTGKAARLEGFHFIGIEREAEYVEIAKARIGGAA